MTTCFHGILMGHLSGVCNVILAELEVELCFSYSIITFFKAFQSVPWRGETHKGKHEVPGMGI